MVNMEAGKTVVVALKSSTSTECREALQWAINFFVKAGVDQVILAHVVKIPDLIPTPSKFSYILMRHSEGDALRA